MIEKRIDLDCSEKAFFKIGRNPDCDIMLPHPTVSASHAELHVIMSVDGKSNLFIKDKNSKHGIYVEGHKVPSTFILPNSNVQICVFRLKFELDGNTVYITISETKEQYTLESVGVSYRSGKTELLNSIDIVVRPGEFVGIFGPSGSGKTTFLKMLNGYRTPSNGFVAVGGMPPNKYFELAKNFIAYVPQEDVLYPGLSIRELLEYAGILRLPEDVTEKQRNEYIDQILEELDLLRIQHQWVSSLSGGQRKRVSIGIEILSKSKILIADEPDAGLDPHIRAQLMDVLRKKANAESVVIMTTHTLENFFLFDHVVIISRGKLCFFGPPEEAVRFFNDKGETNLTPLQIFMRLAGISSGNGEDDSVMADRFSSQYAASEHYNKYVTKRRISRYSCPEESRQDLTAGTLSRILNFCKDVFFINSRQLIALTDRHLNSRLRSYKSLALYLLIPIIIILVISAQKVKSPDEIESIKATQNNLISMINAPEKVADQRSEKTKDASMGIMNPGRNSKHSGIDLNNDDKILLLSPRTPHVIPLILVLAAIFCGIFISCMEISQERNVYIREHKLAINIGSYLYSKLFFLFGITFVEMSLLMMGTVAVTGVSTIPLLQGIIILSITSWAGVSLGLLLSSLDKNGRSAMLISIIVIIPQIIFSGAIGPAFYAKMNPFAKSISNLFISRWGFEGMLKIFNDRSIIEWGPAIVKQQIGFPEMNLIGNSEHFALYLILGSFVLVCLFFTAVILKLQENSE